MSFKYHITSIGVEAHRNEDLDMRDTLRILELGRHIDWFCTPKPGAPGWELLQISDDPTDRGGNQVYYRVVFRSPRN